MIEINEQVCVGCGRCEAFCPEDALRVFGKVSVAAELCNDCLICIEHCPVDALGPQPAPLPPSPGTPRHESCDVLVLGSGIGGLCAAALLAVRGYKTLVIEKLPLIGGRCSTIDYKGYKIPTGALGVPSRGPFREVFTEVGADYPARPSPQGRYIVDGEEITVPEKGGFRAMLSLLSKDEAEVNRVLDALGRADHWEDPSNEISFLEWLGQFTTNDRLKGFFKNLCATYAITEALETSAKDFIWIRRNMIRSYGQAHFSPKGSIALMESLAEAIRAHGGEVRPRAQAKQILVRNQEAAGAVLQDSAGEYEVTAKTVISNLGPRATVSLAGEHNFDSGYMKEIDRMIPTFQMWVSTASDRPFFETQAAFIGTRRVLSCINPTLVCPELAPPGKYLHHSISGPASQTGHWDLKEEIELHLQDLRDLVPGFDDRGEVVHIGCYWGDWPTSRNGPYVGYSPVSQKTPVENLYNVGDGVGPRGWPSGTSGCAMTARIVAQDVEQRIEPGA